MVNQIFVVAAWNSLLQAVVVDWLLKTLLHTRRRAEALSIRPEESIVIPGRQRIEACVKVAQIWINKVGRTTLMPEDTCAFHAWTWSKTLVEEVSSS